MIYEMTKQNERHKTGKNTKEEMEQSETASTNDRKVATGLNLLAEVSTLAWNLVLPIVGGVLLGEYLDKRTGNDFQWTISLLVLGVLIAFGNLYNLYNEHGRQTKSKEDDQSGDEVVDDQEK